MLGCAWLGVYVCVCAFYRVAFYTEVLNIRTEADVCPEPVFSRTNLPFFSTDPHEVCVLRRVVAANCSKRTMKQILCRMRGEGPHLVYRPSLQCG